MSKKYHFLIGLLMLAFLAAGPAWAQMPPVGGVETTPVENPYVVTDMVVDVSAENAVKAREKAFNEALVKAYGVVIGRLLPDVDPAVRAAVAPDAGQIGLMLQDFSTTHEKLSPTRYTATYEMRFKPQEVDQAAALLRARGAVAGTPDPTKVGGLAPVGNDGKRVWLILPFYQKDGKLTLWSGENPLREAWQGTPLSAPNIRVPLGDLEDMQTLDAGVGLNIPAGALTTLLARYGADEALMAVASPGPGGVPGVFDIALYRASPTAPAPRFVQSLSAVPLLTLPDQGAAVAQIVTALQALPTLAGAGNVPAAAPVPGPQSLQLWARFANLAEWQQVRARLNGVDGVSNVRLLSLKARAARLELSYTGAIEVLMTAFSARGLHLAPSADDATTYDLTFDPWAATVVVKP